MYILSFGMWFQKLMRQFFFGIDSVIYNFISDIYNLLINIARTSIFTQADILDMADRIYKLLAIFMIFKVTLSLITYIVNPDDFSDKTKGVSKLGANAVISLGLLILTPYLFNMAYSLQTYILEDNTLATVIFSDEVSGGTNFLSTAGEEMAFITINAFYSPSLSLDEAQGCLNLTDENGYINSECFGLNSGKRDATGSYDQISDTDGTLAGLANNSAYFDIVDLQNYAAGLENKKIGLAFRQDMAVATTEKVSMTSTNQVPEQVFVMDYKILFSTTVGIVIVLILVTYCMDVAVRSVKLGFLQLIAPIPIISFIDPKSGKDGLFKKWYQMCFKTFLSLFIRLLALYFAVYIIEKVSDRTLTDVVDGTQKTGFLLNVFVIIGALMFAKQLPKILEGLGIKLDGDGKFILNPLKKFEEQAALGKNITGAARGTLVGTAGMISGAGIGRAFSGAWRGMKSGKGWSETGKAEIEMNKKMRQARLDGSTFGGRIGARISNNLGLPSASENTDSQIKRLEESVKERNNEIKNLEHRKEQDKDTHDIQRRKRQSGMVSKSLGNVKNVAVEKMKEGVGTTGARYAHLSRTYEALKNSVGQTLDRNYSYIDRTGATISFGAGEVLTNADLIQMQMHISDYDQNGWQNMVDESRTTVGGINATLNTAISVADEDYETIHGPGTAAAALANGAGFNRQLGAAKADISRAEAEERAIDEQYHDEIANLKEQNQRDEEEQRNLYEQQRRQKADDSAVK